MPNPFKKGDKIRLIKHGMINGESVEWTVRARMILNDVYVVAGINGSSHVRIQIPSGATWTFNVGHFERAHLSNTERIQKRKEKANAI